MHQLVVKRFQHCLMHGVTMKFLTMDFSMWWQKFRCNPNQEVLCRNVVINKQRAAIAITQTAGVFITWTSNMQTPNSNHLDMCRLSDVIFAVLLKFMQNSALLCSVVAQATWCLETNQLYPSRIIRRPIRAHTQTHIRNIDRERKYLSCGLCNKRVMKV